MKILVINPGNIFGGIESLILSTAECRACCPGLELVFGVCFEGHFSRELEGCGVPVVRLGGVRLSRPWTMLKARKRVSSELRRGEYDVVICHGAWSLAIFGPVVRMQGIPLAFWLHDPPPQRLPWLERLAAPTRPDLLICNSRYTAEGSAHYYPSVPRSKIYCLVPAPAIEYAKADRVTLRRELETPEDATVIVQVGRLDPHKGLDTHLRALAELRELPNWYCWMTASPQRPVEELRLKQLTALAEELGVADRVRFLGWQRDVRRVFAAADIYCQPNSGPEPFGITFVEALWAKLPVVASALGGALEIITEDCGMLTTPRDSRAVAGALRRLLTDSELRRRLSEAGPARAAELCSPELQLNKLYELLQSLTPSGTDLALNSLGDATAEG